MFKMKLLHENFVFLPGFSLAFVIFTLVTRCSVPGSCKKGAFLGYFVAIPGFFTLG